MTERATRSRALWARIMRAAVVAVVLNGCESSATLSGEAVVVDGDSLEIGSTSIRLYAIDAPEGRQTCRRADVEWRCGDAAAEKLRQLVAGRTVVCVQKDTDTYGRTVAVCNNGAVDLGAELVSAGLALAYRRFDDRYVDEEAAAQAAGRGMWAGEFTAPWDWRQQSSRQQSSRQQGSRQQSSRQQGSGPQSSSGASAGDGCLIKGNINRENERIYHLPGSSSYEATVVDESRGERWFCSEAEAREAGWRAPRSGASGSRRRR